MRTNGQNWIVYCAQDSFSNRTDKPPLRCASAMRPQDDHSWPVLLQDSINYIGWIASVEDTRRLWCDPCRLLYRFGQPTLKISALHAWHVRQFLGLHRRLLKHKSVSHDQVGVVVLRQKRCVAFSAPNTRRKISSQYDCAQRLSVILFFHVGNLSRSLGIAFG